MRLLPVVLVFLCPHALNAQEVPAQENKTEAALLKQFEGRITRKGDTLRFHTPIATASLKDNPGLPDAAYAKHVLIDTYRVRKGRTDFLVHVQLYEGDSYILVNGATGATVCVQGKPVLSPGHHRYLSAGTDLEGGSAVTVEVVWADDFEKEFVKEYRGGEGPTEAHWLDEHKIFLMEKREDSSDKTGFRMQRTTIELVNDEWVQTTTR